VTAYTTREVVAAALDIQAPAYASARIDRAVEAASRNVDALCHRPNGFAPYFATYTWDYPNDQTATAGRLWLDDRTLLELTGAGDIDVADVLPLPQGSPPYDYIELDRDSGSSFGNSVGTQGAIALTGRWGHTDEWAAAGTATALASTTASSFTISAGSVGVGSLLRIDSEYMHVTGKGWVASGQLSTVALGADSSDIAVSVSDGTAFTAGEALLIDGERVQVNDISGNTLYVRRAVDGSVLSAHDRDVTISWPRALTVQRGANGSTAATHSNGATVSMWVAPALISSLAVAYAEDELLQSASGYARTIGSGESQQQYAGRGVVVLEKRVERAYGRRARSRAV
jgi:hypothetical protein